MNPDFKDMLRLLGVHEVEYLIIGGYAVIRHTQPRFTKDLDIWLRPERGNAARTARAFHEFGIPLIEVTEEDLAHEGLQYTVGVYPSAIDFLTTVQPLDFEEAWSTRAVFETASGPLNYLSIPSLIRTKRHSGRLQDLADVEEILRLHPDADPDR